MKTNFKFTLEELYEITNAILFEIKTEDISAIRKNRLLTELIETAEQLVRNNCKRFIREAGVTELTEEELYTTATGHALWMAIQGYDITRGIHFLNYWYMVMNSYFKNEFRKATNITSKFHGGLYSTDKVIDENGGTLLSYESVEDFTEVTCNTLTLEELINKFEQRDKFGKVIRCELIGTQSIKRNALLKVLGADSYGDKERKAVERTKKRFAKFLIESGFDCCY